MRVMLYFCSIKDRNNDSETSLSLFLEKEHNMMVNRMKSTEREFDPYTKDVRLVDEKWVTLNSFNVCKIPV